jgi:UDP-N-acetyl-D-mannosaminuronate dehydrogenase
LVDEALVVVAGLGEVGCPLMNILSRTFTCAGIDVDPVTIECEVSVLHICYPFQIGSFNAVTAEYICKLRPELTIIHSSVPPGTTREIQEHVVDYPVAFSPVRGKHVRMEDDMLRYRKFVAAPRQRAVGAALDHLSQAGFHTGSFPSPEVGELAKLLETTYLGVLIAWAQEMERLAAQYGGTFNDVNSFVEEIDFLPSHTYPGVIGGHCVMPNIELLRGRVESKFLDLVVESNSLKKQIQTPVLAGSEQ